MSASFDLSKPVTITQGSASMTGWITQASGDDQYLTIVVGPDPQ